MLLKESSLKQFSEVLASNAPAPGGGSVAALNGTLAAALIQMTGSLTTGSEKYKEYHAELQEIIDNARKLQNKLLNGVDEDTEAFNKVSAVFSMPKETPEQKAARSEAMQTALKGAADTPLQTMKAAYDCLKLAEAAYKKINPSCSSDMGNAVLCALAAVRGAWLNVKINLSGLKDEVYKDTINSEARAILVPAEKLAEELYGSIEREV